MGKLKIVHQSHADDDVDIVHEFHDGRLIVYKRQRSRFWQARARLETETAYRFKSLKTTNLQKAIELANEQYIEWKVEKKRGFDSRPKLMSEVISKFIKDLDRRVSSGETTKHMAAVYRTQAGSYIKEFFGNKTIASITKATMEAYCTWRITKATEKPPAKQTLNMERTTLGIMFQFAHDKGWIGIDYPKLKVPKLVNGDDGLNRRAAFTREEMERIPELLEHWIFKGYATNQEYSREMLKTYVLLIAKTGMRTNDFHDRLKWRDMQKMHLVDAMLGFQRKNIRKTNELVGDVDNHIIMINATGKSIEHPVLGDAEAVGLLLNWNTICKWTEDDDLVFCITRGVPYEFASPFKKFLVWANMLNDANGKPRTPYSLRHTYATLRLDDGDIRTRELAKQMGTSETMIAKHYDHGDILDKIDAILPKKKGKSDI